MAIDFTALKELNEQRQVLLRNAAGEIATRMAQVKTLLDEIEVISDMAEMLVETWEVQNKLTNLSSNWQSSSYYC